MLRMEIRSLQQRLGVTTVMVTHDQEEALTMADRILVMDHGRLVQEGAPRDIYDRPATPFVASFIGSMNFIRDGVKKGDGLYQAGDLVLRAIDGDGAASLANESRVIIAIRPEDVMLSPQQRPNDDSVNLMLARVESMEYRGSIFRVSLRLPVSAETSVTIESDMSSEKVARLAIREHMEVPVHFPADRLRVYGI